MSEENKDLGDMAEDAKNNANEGAENLGDKAKGASDSAKEKASNLADDAKEAAKDFGETASEKFDDAKEATKEFADDAKEAAGEFADDVKNAAEEFKEEAKKTFDPSSPDSGKTVAIIAHITIIGWIVALIMNNQNKTEFGSYYIRQTLGIWLIAIVLNFIPVVGCFASLICLVLIIISLVAAANGKMTPTVGIGEMFQNWFSGL